MTVKPLALTAALAVALVFSACTDKNRKQEPQMEMKQPAAVVADSMIYGTCGDGTSMHVVELVCADGKRRSFSINDGSDVQGGLQAGDSIAVLSRHDEDGTASADIVINVSSLADRWVSLGQTLSLYKEGKALAKTKEAKPVVSWKLCNGLLVVGKDTFRIKTLGPDSLYLLKGNNVTGYRRMPK